MAQTNNLKITPEYVVMGASGGSQEFIITADTTISAVNVTILSGSATHTPIDTNSFLILIGENKTTTDREIIGQCVITFEDGNKEVLKFVIINKATSLNFDKTVYIANNSDSELLVYGDASNNLSDSLDIVINSTEQWITTSENYYRDGRQYIKFNIQSNESIFRKAVVNVNVLKDSRVILSRTIVVAQSIGDVVPIWKDCTYVESIDSEFIEYHIEYGDSVIFAGKAYPYPGSNKVEILLNDIVTNYLHNVLDFETGIISDYANIFTIVTSTGVTKPYIFINDWSYKDVDYVNEKFLSNPITGYVDPRQRFMFSYFSPFNSSSLTVDINGDTSTVSESSGVGGYSYVTSLDRSLLCDSKISVNQNSDSLHYVIDDSGKNYVLYYINAAGGWDSLLIDGNVKKVDLIESQTYTKKTLNTSLEFDRTKYLNTITGNWTLYTGYLTDTQASKMYNLLESNCVYLHNLVDDEIIPVNITNSSCEYKTYSNQGKRKFYYTIEVEASKDKYRM